MNRRTFGWLSLAGVLALSACAEERRLGEDPHRPLVVTKKTELPPPTGADLVAATTAYRIGPLDKLSIAVFDVPDLSGEFQTDAAGRLSLPLIGEIDASSETPSELAATIAAKLRERFMRDPQVTVNVKETTSQAFTVDGQVAQPGSYPMQGNMSLVRAVATAKGAGEFARLEDVVVFRTVDGQVAQPGSYPMQGNMSLVRAVATAKGAGEFARLEDVVVFRTVDGQRMAALYNLDAIRKGLYPDPKIYANDLIIVGDSKARRMFQQILTVAPLLSTPVILVLEKF
jgi:polysaccharide biosynthesis/export protein